jgi:hypothetical protein
MVMARISSGARPEGRMGLIPFSVGPELVEGLFFFRDDALEESAGLRQAQPERIGRKLAIGPAHS